MADLSLTIGAKDEASPAFRKVADAARGMGKEVETSGTQAAKGGEKIAGGVFKAQVAFEALSKAAGIAVDFLKGGIKDYIEQEKANVRLAAAVRQLGYDANTLAPALAAMADEMESATLVSAENIEQVQKLLLQYGVAPRDIRKTTQALLDYSAATGKSAATAAEELSRALIGGGEKMNAFGISVKRTGDRTTDLNAIVDKMATLFGGSAAAATEGFAGKVGALQKSQDDLGKAFGGFIADVESKYHVLETLTVALNKARLALTGEDEDYDAHKKRLQLAIDQSQDWVDRLRKDREELEKDHQAGKVFDFIYEANVKKFGDRMGDAVRKLQGYRLELAQLEKDHSAANPALDVPTSGTAGTGNDDGGGGSASTAAIEAAEKARAERLKRAFQVVQDELDYDTKQTEEKAKQHAAFIKAYVNATMKDAERQGNALAHALERQDAEWQRLLGGTRNRLGQLSTSVAAKAVDDGSKEMENAGLALGNAFIGGLDQSLSQMESGGEFDVGAIIASVLPALVTIGAIAAGVPAPVAPILGQAAGVLAKHAMAGMGGGGKYHSGGEVDHRPRFHSGGGLASDEVEAVLQTGEMVFSRGDVARHGGPQQLDQMRRGGGGGMNVYVSTLDSQSFSQFMGARGGTGLTRTLATNRGEFAQYARRAGLKVS